MNLQTGLTHPQTAATLNPQKETPTMMLKIRATIIAILFALGLALGSLASTQAAGPTSDKPHPNPVTNPSCKACGSYWVTIPPEVVPTR